eukprot:COSAG04_NODE_14003_length_584_cov_0.725773_1_plen_137_part_10
MLDEVEPQEGQAHGQQEEMEQELSQEEEEQEEREAREPQPAPAAPREADTALIASLQQQLATLEQQLVSTRKEEGQKVELVQQKLEDIQITNETLETRAAKVPFRPSLTPACFGFDAPLQTDCDSPYKSILLLKYSS